MMIEKKLLERIDLLEKAFLNIEKFIKIYSRKLVDEFGTKFEYTSLIKPKE